MFSTEQKVEDVPPTEEELARNRDEWGIKYTDECFKFEKEWKAIADKIDAEYNYISSINKANIDRGYTLNKNWVTFKRKK